MRRQRNVCAVGSLDADGRIARERDLPFLPGKVAWAGAATTKSMAMARSSSLGQELSASFRSLLAATHALAKVPVVLPKLVAPEGLLGLAELVGVLVVAALRAGDRLPVGQDDAPGCVRQLCLARAVGVHHADLAVAGE